jgi:vanillate O-demethylase monooxygenase subunit
MMLKEATALVQSAKPGFAIPGLPRDSDDLPPQFAPLIRNAWYAMAVSQDVGSELRAIRVLGEPLVYYRTEAGEPVVLDDRCAHRRFPLSKSKRVGDTIQCGYHGFTYDVTGKCVWAPSNANPNFGIRRYPCVEVGPWLWVWMGDPDKADPSTVPYPHLDESEHWHQIEGYKLNPGNYMLLIENLLDLTHLHFLHGAAVSTAEQAVAPTKSVPGVVNGVHWTKTTEVSQAGIMGELMGADPTQLVRVEMGGKQVGPSINYGYEDRFVTDGVEAPLYPLRFFIIHALTPETLDTTHQFFQASFNRDLPAGLDHFREISENFVFQQDCDTIALISHEIAQERRAENIEFGVTGDRHGVAMRAILRRMKQEEMQS